MRDAAPLASIEPAHGSYEGRGWQHASSRERGAIILTLPAYWQRSTGRTLASASAWQGECRWEHNLWSEFVDQSFPGATAVSRLVSRPMDAVSHSNAVRAEVCTATVNYTLVSSAPDRASAAMRRQLEISPQRVRTQSNDTRSYTDTRSDESDRLVHAATTSGCPRYGTRTVSCREAVTDGVPA